MMRPRRANRFQLPPKNNPVASPSFPWSLVPCFFWRYLLTMQEPVQLAGLILAAGDSTRMGTDKAMLPWPPPPSDATDPPRHTLLSAALLAFDPLTRLNVVVAGRNADAISITVGACGAYLVHNPSPDNGQFSSLQIGLRDLLDRG